MLLAASLLAGGACSNEGTLLEPPAPSRAQEMQAPQVLALAHGVAQREPVLAARFARKGWRTTSDGITSAGWTSLPGPGRERVASRVPARADGAWETKIAGSKALHVSVRVEGSQPSAAEVHDGRVIFRDTFTSTHTLFSADAHEAELNFMLLDARAPRAFAFELGLHGSELEARQDDDGEIAFVDRSGRTRLILGAAYAVDARGERRDALLYLDGSRVRMELDPTGLQYPILLDPPLSSPAWTQKSPASSPSARRYSGMATLGSKVVLFGGNPTAGGTLNDTWEWDGTNWTQKAPATSPPVRDPFNQMATFGDHIILFSGDSGRTADTWKWDGTNWSQLSPAKSPPGRRYGSMAALNSNLYLYGGSGASGVLGDTWAWNGTTWSELATSGPTPARSNAAMTTFDGKILFFGGFNPSSIPYFNDTWSFDGTNWSQLSPAASPSTRLRFSMTALPGSVFLIGGQTETTYDAKAYEWDGSTWWTRDLTPQPDARYGQRVAALNGEVVMFGGSASSYYGDTWVYADSVVLGANGTACSAGTECSSGNCVDGVCCDTACAGGTADCQACNVSGSAGTCTFLPSSTVCRTANGDCDAAESCSGAAAACPSDGFKSNGTSCRASGGLCDPAEVCSGSSATCPADTKYGNETTCRSAADSCDAAETCNGSDVGCPPDAKRPSGAECRAAGGVCDLQEVCDGSSNACPADARRGSGTSCASDDNPCTQDICDGSSVDCTHPAGNAGVACRMAAGECDVAETCTGSSSVCPDDAKRPNTTLCRNAVGGCDVAEYCSGSGNDCPADQLAGTGVVCRVSAGSCDIEEACSGSDPQCPNDAVRDPSHVCRISAGECDVADTCDGSSTGCPNDVRREASAPCTADDNPCTLDVCDGTSVSCTHPAGNLGATCRAANGGCDVAETCSGDSTACPTDAFLGSSSVCRAASCDAGVQVREASCAGDSPNCPNAVNEACEEYACGTSACFTSCETAAQCAPEHYCENSQCQPQRANGASCGSGDQCTSGLCVDGYCCDAACGGQCEACNVAGRLGQCSAVTGAPQGSREACETDGTNCGGACDGDTRTACSYPGNGQVCRVASCADGVATFEARCGGDGECGPLLTQSCEPSICDPDSPACLGDCAVDSECIEGYFCSAGVCTQKFALGAACTASNQCASDECVDDVCCNSACDQQCEACDVADEEGTCTPVVGDPHGARDACAGDGSMCDGACNGSMRDACEYPDAATNCRLGSCSGGVATVAAFCDGAGACPALETQSCAPFTCGSDACLGDCAEDSDCASGSFCSANVCTAKRALGESCAASNACVSAFCVDGVCCDAACQGQCEACDVTGVAGTCTPVIGAPHGARAACDSDSSACAGACDGSDREGCAYPAAETPCRSASCASGVATLAAACLGTGACPSLQQQACDPYVCGETQCAGDCVDTAGCVSGSWCSAGVCVPRLAQGQACGANEQCLSDICADGRCCDVACDGQCEACDRTGSLGTCGPVTGAPRGGRAACAGSGTCAGSCDGVEARACTFPGAAVTCTTAKCENGTATRAAGCNGAGACNTAAHRDCSPYVCGATDCASACTGDGECVDGRICSDGQCRLPAAADGGVDAGTEPPPVDAGVESDAGVDAGTVDAAVSDPELDSDGDGIPDLRELGADGQSLDSDGDGVPNELDDDDDGDSIPTREERGRGRASNDLDRDGVPNHLDRDADGDGVDDEEEAKGDIDGDGIPDYKDPPRLGISGGALCEVRQVGAAPSGAGWLFLAALLWWAARRVRHARMR